MPTKRELLADIFKKAKADLIVMESCGPSGWINDLALSMEIKKKDIGTEHIAGPKFTFEYHWLKYNTTVRIPSLFINGGELPFSTV